MLPFSGRMWYDINESKWAHGAGKGELSVKIRWKTVWLTAVALAACCLLSGCSFFSTAESLFTLPQLPIEYTDLADQIRGLIADGYEYASPTSGRNIQSVQMVDLDGDGDEEAIAFFRRSSDEKPLKIFIFRADEGGYESLCTIESSGTAIDSVYYRDLTGDGVQELVVGWRIAADVQTVAVYGIDQEPRTLMQSSYVRFSLEELNGDGIPSLLILRADENGGSVAEFYSWQEEAMSVSYESRISDTMAELSRGSVVSGVLKDDLRAVFISGVSEEGEVTTDILTYRDGSGLVNVTMDPQTGRSGSTQSYLQLRPQDINGDGAIEVPSPCVDEAGQPTGMVEWLAYSEWGRAQRAAITYHDPSGSWYFVLPESWWDRVTVSTADRGPYEIQTTLLVDGQETVSFYMLTGENRENRAMRGNRLVLKRQTGTVYAGELLLGAEDLELTESVLRQNFKLISYEWTIG